MSGYSPPRPIRDTDDLANFHSGEPDLDAYLRKRALANHLEGASRCFVTCRGQRVIGFSRGRRGRHQPVVRLSTAPGEHYPHARGRQ